jgi:hypothetical protein
LIDIHGVHVELVCVHIYTNKAQTSRVRAEIRETQNARDDDNNDNDDEETFTKRGDES